LELKEANTWMTGTLPSRKVSKAVTVTILVMQRLHQDDPTGNRLRTAMASNGGDPVKHICLPASDEYKIRPRRLAKYYTNGIMNPKRTSRAVLDNVRAQSGEQVLACQYGQDPRPAGGGMFKRDRVKIVRVAPPDEDFIRIVRYWDKAGTLNAGAWTVGLKMGLQHVKTSSPKPLKLFWVLDVVRFREDATNREDIILKTAQSDGQRVEICIEEEGGSGGKESAQNTVSNLAGFRVKRDKPTGDKALRADPASDQWNNFCFRVLEGPWNMVYLDEMGFFPYSTYKDQGDGTSGAFAYLMKPRLVVGAF
jgi:phage terminase large subunit-like protein